MGQGQCGGDVLLILSLLASGDCQYTCHKTDKTPRTETRRGLSGGPGAWGAVPRWELMGTKGQGGVHRRSVLHTVGDGRP